MPDHQHVHVIGVLGDLRRCFCSRGLGAEARFGVIKRRGKLFCFVHDLEKECLVVTGDESSGVDPVVKRGLIQLAE